MTVATHLDGPNMLLHSQLDCPLQGPVWKQIQDHFITPVLHFCDEFCRYNNPLHKVCDKLELAREFLADSRGENDALQQQLTDSHAANAELRQQLAAKDVLLEHLQQQLAQKSVGAFQQQP